MPKPERPVVAIVGGGFSGLMTALHLTRTGLVSVRLIEKTATFARGTAYSTANPDHLLNVRASNMSAWPEDPAHFTRWLAARRPGADGPTFARRGEYGQYLQDLLKEAAQGRDAAERLSLVADSVVALEPDGDGWRVGYANGASEHADAVVLAVGNPPPAAPRGIAPELLHDPRYHPDPWRLDPQALGSDDAPVLLIGAGLTMVDVALSVAGAAPGRPLIALSRRGLSPLSHAPTAPTEAIAPPAGLAPSALLAWLKARSRVHGWRETVDALRPWTQGVWRGWNDAQRASFLRHARPYWDVHRHRLAPEIGQRVAALGADGGLSFLTGRIETLAPGPNGLRLRWTPRGETTPRTLDVGAAINCTGPGGALSPAADPLLGVLRDAGVVRGDRQGLALDVDAGGRPIGQSGTPHPGLFAVGPVTRGAFWEIMAVPDIRVQAAQVARAIIQALPVAPAI